MRKRRVRPVTLSLSKGDIPSCFDRLSTSGPLLALTLAALLAGCVKRTIVVESEPPGARVWVNEHRLEKPTPVEYPFITHGRYKIRVEKSGFQAVTAREMVRAPVYQWIPLDLIFDVLVPFTLQDKHVFKYRLTPAPSTEGALPATQEEVQSALKNLKDPSPHKRRAACLALARARDPATAPAVSEATGDPDPAVRRAALGALRGILGKHSLPGLIQALREDSEPEVRWQAATELEALKDTQAVTALIAALRDRHPIVRAGAAEALKGIPDAQAVPGLVRALRDKDTAARRAAAEGLGKIGDRAAVRPLTRVLSHHDFLTRRRAAKSLGQLGDPSAAIPLARTLDNWDPQLRRISSHALIQMGDRRAVPLLIRYLRSWKAATREEAAIVLGGLKDPRSLEPLRRAARKEPNERTHSAMQTALAALEGVQ